MTKRRRKIGVFIGLASLTALAIAGEGCSPAATDTAHDEEWTQRPPPLAPWDGGENAAADGSDAQAEAEVPEVPEQLCTLAGPPPVTNGDVLVFSDEFEGNQFATNKWNVRDGYRRTGVLNTASASLSRLEGGSLFIDTERNPSDQVYPFVAGYIDTLHKFARTYGKVEFRARFPWAPGVWFAIWGRPWSQPFPEIDIEVVNRASGKTPELYFVNHWAAPPLPADERRTFTLLQSIDVSQFHTYTVLWKPDLLEWQVDGVPYMQGTTKGIPQLPVFWMINGWVGAWAGTPPDDLALPVTFEVDYMRVYRVDGLIGEPAVILPPQKPGKTFSRSDAITLTTANFDEACTHVEMYDGDRLVRTTSTSPYRFPLTKLTRGAHTLTFVATDGVRRTSESLQAEIN